MRGREPGQCMQMALWPSATAAVGGRRRQHQPRAERPSSPRPRRDAMRGLRSRSSRLPPPPADEDCGRRWTRPLPLLAGMLGCAFSAAAPRVPTRQSRLERWGEGRGRRRRRSWERAKAGRREQRPWPAEVTIKASVVGGAGTAVLPAGQSEVHQNKSQPVATEVAAAQFPGSRRGRVREGRG